jgi:predicted AlkP superfamily phosphohydrolase/phosphomutase
MKKFNYLFLGLYCFLLILPLNAYAEITSTKPKVILIGADGLTEKVIAQLLSQNKLKNIQYLREHGSYGHIISIEPTLSPALWTTMATGKNREDHGILGFAVMNQKGEGVLVNRSHRKTKAIWNILSEAQKKVGIIRYFVTWPAEKVNGFMISKTFVFPVAGGYYPFSVRKTLQEVLKPYINYDLNQLEQFAELEKKEQFQLFTPEMFNLLDRLGTRLINGYLNLKSKPIYSETEREQYWEFFQHNKVIERAVFEAYFTDYLHFEIAKKLYQPDLDFFTLYMKGPDIVSHHNWGYYEPDSRIPQKDVSAFKDVIPNYYVFIDNVVGYFRQVAPSDTVIILVSDHGFEKWDAVLQYDVNKVLNTMGYLDYDKDGNILRNKIFDEFDYFWRDRPWHSLPVDLNGIFLGRDVREDETKMKQIIDQMYAITVGERKLFENIYFYSRNSIGLYQIKAKINSYFYQEFAIKNLPLDKKTITINQKSYPLSDYFKYSFTEGKHSTYDGVIYLMGPCIKPNNFLKNGISVLDVTPAILKIFDLPIGQDMAGKVPINIFEPEFINRHPVSYVKSYDDLRALSPEIPYTESPVDNKIKQQLRSLGYIQ